MSWLSATWVMIATAIGMVGLVHGFAWMKLRDARANGAFMLLACSLALLVLLELQMLRADTPEAFGEAVWRYHFALWGATVGCVLYMRDYLRAGRRWLGWLAIGFRSVVAAINAFSSPNINFTQIVSLEHVDLWGESVAIAHGEPSAWMLLGLAAFVALAMFVADAARSLWRAGDRIRGGFVGGLVAMLVFCAGLSACLYVWGVFRVPALVALWLIPIGVALALEAGETVIRAARVAHQLEQNSVELRESEARLNLAADVAGVALWRIQGDSGRFWSTRRASEILGLPPEARPGLDEFFERVQPGDRERVRRALHEAQRAGSASVEYRVRMPDGEERWLLSMGKGRLPPPELPSTVAGVTIDVTERRRVELAAVRQRAELEQLAKAANISEFSSAMTHEMSQPLAIIMSNAEAAQGLISRAEATPDSLREIFDDIVDADERASRVLSRFCDLLDQDSARRVTVSLNGLIDQALDVMRDELAGFELEDRRAPELPDTSADPVLIGQVLFNLIRNACQAMKLNEPGDRKLVIETHAVAGTVVFRVSDHGVGLPEESEQVFEPFFTTKAEGMGIGLSICRSIIESHGGRIGAEPRVERGASFWFSLPCLQAPVLPGFGVA